MRMPSSPLFHLSRKTSEPRIWLSGTLVFKRKFIKVKHQNLEAVLEGVS